MMYLPPSGGQIYFIFLYTLVGAQAVLIVIFLMIYQRKKHDLVKLNDQKEEAIRKKQRIGIIIEENDGAYGREIFIRMFLICF